MRLFHSIRWQLQFWHGLLLALVLAGFGFTAWQLQKAGQLRRADAELERRALAIEAAMLRGTGTPETVPPPPTHLTLTAEEANLFAGPTGNPFYYVAWRHDFKELARSAGAPAGIPRPERGSQSSAWRWRGTLREHSDFAPRGECILVGQDLQGRLAASRRFAGLLAVAGGGVLALGLAGGAWISRRALRPIEAISATATKIASGDLSQRVSIHATADELGQLVSVLNSTFTRLEASFARQARFTADAAHELRTPIAVISMHTENGLARKSSDPGQREAFVAIQRAALRMRRLTESLLTLVRLDSGEAAIRENCDLSEIAREAVETLHPLAQVRKLDFSLELAPARLTANAEQLGQVVTNLLSNAIHHSRAGGSISVKVRSERDAAVLVVADAGEGISPGDLPHIFERFYRADQSRSSAGGRVGLGLAITQAIVQAHGGSVAVESELGKGSSFTVRLPVTGSESQIVARELRAEP